MRGIERRRFRRFSFDSAVWIEEIGKSRGIYGSVARDVSAGGLRIRVGKFLAKDRDVKLRFELPQFAGQLTVRGKVRWVSVVPYSDNVYEVGVEFNEMDISEKRQIERWIEHRLN